MAFTFREFAIGAFAAWCTFIAILLVSICAIMVVSGDPVGLLLLAGHAGVTGGAISLAVMLTASPLAWLLGTMLRRIRYTAVHIAAFAALGMAVGFGLFLLYATVSGLRIPDALRTPGAWVPACASSISVISGWLCAVRYARRTDASIVVAARLQACIENNAEYRALDS